MVYFTQFVTSGNAPTERSLPRPVYGHCISSSGRDLHGQIRWSSSTSMCLRVTDSPTELFCSQRSGCRGMSSILAHHLVGDYNCLTISRTIVGQHHPLTCSVLLVRSLVNIQMFHGGAGSCGKLHWTLLKSLESSWPVCKDPRQRPGKPEVSNGVTKIRRTQLWCVCHPSGKMPSVLSGGISLSFYWTTCTELCSCIGNGVTLLGAKRESSDDQRKRATPAKIESLGILATTVYHDELKANF
jgi:hypothetical protein